MRIGLGTTTALSTALLACVAPAWAQGADAVRRYDAPAGPLARTLSVFVEQSRLQILYPAALVEGRTSPGLQGDYSAEAGLAALLRDTGLAFRRTRPNVYVLYDPNARAGLTDDELTVVDESDPGCRRRPLARGQHRPGPDGPRGPGHRGPAARRAAAELRRNRQ